MSPACAAVVDLAPIAVAIIGVAMFALVGWIAWLRLR